MESPWLRCKVSPGQFSEEYVVEAKDFQNNGFSLFVPDSLVECDHEPTEDESTEGWLQVKVLDQRDNLALIHLPRTPFENGPTVTVERGQLNFRMARELA